MRLAHGLRAAAGTLAAARVGMAATNLDLVDHTSKQASTLMPVSWGRILMVIFAFATLGALLALCGAS